MYYGLERTFVGLWTADGRYSQDHEGGANGVHPSVTVIPSGLEEGELRQCVWDLVQRFAQSLSKLLELFISSRSDEKTDQIKLLVAPTEDLGVRFSILDSLSGSSEWFVARHSEYTSNSFQIFFFVSCHYEYHPTERGLNILLEPFSFLGLSATDTAFNEYRVKS